jgi:hypothetical protein
MESLRRLLELVCRELDARDARVELFGEPPDDASTVVVRLADHMRLVVTFDAPVAERREPLQERLRALVDGFGHAATDAAAAAVGDALAVSTTAQAELVEALGVVRERAGASLCVIIDERSPEIWAADPPLSWTRIDEATPGDDALLQRLGGAIDAVQCATPPPEGVGVVSLLGLYRLIVVDGGGALRVEGAVRRARPVLERLLRAMPPRQPPRIRAAVVPLRE